jgi:hypothetical protein
MSNENNDPKTNRPLGAWIAIGIAIGAGIGVAMDNIAAGIGFGIALGAAIGAAQTRKSNYSCVKAPSPFQKEGRGEG